MPFASCYLRGTKYFRPVILIWRNRRPGGWRHATCDMQHAACDMRKRGFFMLHDIQASVCDMRKIHLYATSVCDICMRHDIEAPVCRYIISWREHAHAETAHTDTSKCLERRGMIPYSYPCRKQSEPKKRLPNTCFAEVTTLVELFWGEQCACGGACGGGGTHEESDKA